MRLAANGLDMASASFAANQRRSACSPVVAKIQAHRDAVVTEQARPYRSHQTPQTGPD